MKPPLFVRPLTQPERQELEAGLRAKDAFTLRRAQILLASAQGLRPRQIAGTLGCAVQTVRNTLRAFEAAGTQALKAQSRRPKSVQPVLDQPKREQMRRILRQSPRAFGKVRSTWTLALLAQVVCEQGLSQQVLSHETMRVAVSRLGLHWKRAKKRISSPDAAYARKKSAATDCRAR